MKFVNFILMTVVLSGAVYAQMEPDIQSRLEMIYRGEIEEVREELPTLLTRYQNHPGVLYLHGMLTTDGNEAVKIFQSIVDNFPESEWADDALYRMYQYYYSIGLYRTAEQTLERLKREYPRSRYVFGDHPRIADEKEAGEEEPEVIERSYALQVGAFSSYENAMRQKVSLEDIEATVEIITSIRGGRTLYLVWVGSFPDRERAIEYAGQLKRRYDVDAMVVSK